MTNIAEKLKSKLFKRFNLPINLNDLSIRGYRKAERIKLGKTDYKTSKKVLKDTQVKTGFYIIQYLLSSKNWILAPSKHDKEGLVCDFVQEMLENLDTKVEKITKEMVEAVMWGFNAHELLFDVNEDGRIVITDIVPIHIKSLQNEPFYYLDNVLEGLHQTVNNETVYIPLDKVLVYSFGDNYGSPYGDGLIDDLKPIVEDKMNINQWLMNYLEKHEAPTLYGKTDNYNRDELLNFLDEVSEGRSSVVINPDDDVGVLESSHRGESFFNALQWKDNQIFRLMFIGNLLLGDNSQTGTYAQSQSQLEFGQLAYDGILTDMADSWQKQVINRVVELNFGNKKLAPIFKFDKFIDEDYEALLNNLKPYVDNGTIDTWNKTLHDIISQYVNITTGLVYKSDDTTQEEEEEDFNLAPTDMGQELTSNMIESLTGGIEEVK